HRPEREPNDMSEAQKPIDVAIMMGSKSDLETMRPAAKVLEGLGLAVEVRVLSAHRTPEEAAAFVKDAGRRGCKAFICGAGGRARGAPQEGPRQRRRSPRRQVSRATMAHAFDEEIVFAVAALQRGEVVAYPTETFYGLGVDALDELAVARLRALKGRDGKAISVLVDGPAMLDSLCPKVPPRAAALMRRYWPGA